MKKINILLLIVISFFISCKKEQNTETVKDPAPAEKNSTTCYQAVLKKDTITLTIASKENGAVSGTLAYNFYEKDKSSGIVKGTIKGDTIFADYTFSSEGVTSSREVAFLKKGTTLTEGFGKVTDDNKGHVTFKDSANLQFDSKVVFNTVDCKK